MLDSAHWFFLFVSSCLCVMRKACIAKFHFCGTPLSSLRPAIRTIPLVPSSHASPLKLLLSLAPFSSRAPLTQRAGCTWAHFVCGGAGTLGLQYQRPYTNVTPVPDMPSRTCARREA